MLVKIKFLFPCYNSSSLKFNTLDFSCIYIASWKLLTLGDNIPTCTGAPAHFCIYIKWTIIDDDKFLFPYFSDTNTHEDHMQSRNSFLFPAHHRSKCIVQRLLLQLMMLLWIFLIITAGMGTMHSDLGDSFDCKFTTKWEMILRMTLFREISASHNIPYLCHSDKTSNCFYSSEVEWNSF